ncbi:MAG: acetylornithine transaminase [Actinomycetes bacterium]
MTRTVTSQERWNRSLMPNYGTPKVVLSHGIGATVWDVDGKEYVDLLAGIAVNILGHAHPTLVEAVTKQMNTLGHTSNFAAHEPGISLAERLLDLTGRKGKVFFCNSGTEANEAGIKLSRMTGRTELLALEGSFHGRTMGSLSITGQVKKQEPFRPLLPDVQFVRSNDVQHLDELMSEKTSALWFEPISGEGGVLPLSHEFLTAAQRICRETGALLVADEVQTGIARTGAMFAYQHSGLEPDVLLLAKGLGGGFPIGACIAFGQAAEYLQPGTHGTTFGGNAVAAAAAHAVLDVIERDDLISRAKQIGHMIAATLTPLAGVEQVRGEGAMQGVVLTRDVASDVEHRGRELGVILNSPLPNVIRLVPPLVITDDELARGLDRLATAIEQASHD